MMLTLAVVVVAAVLLAPGCRAVTNPNQCNLTVHDPGSWATEGRQPPLHIPSGCKYGTVNWPRPFFRRRNSNDVLPGTLHLRVHRSEPFLVCVFIDSEYNLPKEYSNAGIYINGTGAYVGMPNDTQPICVGSSYSTRSRLESAYKVKIDFIAPYFTHLYRFKTQVHGTCNESVHTTPFSFTHYLPPGCDYGTVNWREPYVDNVISDTSVPIRQIDLHLRMRRRDPFKLCLMADSGSPWTSGHILAREIGRRERETFTLPTRSQLRCIHSWEGESGRPLATHHHVYLELAVPVQTTTFRFKTIVVMNDVCDNIAVDASAWPLVNRGHKLYIPSGCNNGTVSWPKPYSGVDASGTMRHNTLFLRVDRDYNFCVCLKVDRETNARVPWTNGVISLTKGSPSSMDFPAEGAPGCACSERKPVGPNQVAYQMYISMTPPATRSTFKFGYEVTRI